MNKVLVTGLSVGNEVGVCDVCGFDLEWIVRYPSIILWVDKIVLTKSTWDYIVERGENDTTPYYRSVYLIFNLLNSAGLIDVVNTASLFPKNMNEAIIDSVDHDISALVARFPETARLGDDKLVPGQLFISDEEYCSPYLYSVYASLYLAKIVDAQCLFNHRVLRYCSYKFGLGPFPPETKQDKIESFHSIYKSLFPNIPLLSEYAIYSSREGEKACGKCTNKSKCSDSYLIDVESQTTKALSMREREEIEESRCLINKIIDKQAGNVMDHSDLRSEFIKECTRLSRRNKKAFPRVKFWCSLSMILSVPMTVIGISHQAPALIATGAGTLGIATGIKHLVDTLQEKSRWTAYFNKILSE